jgi:hypothetical protein
MDYAIKESTLTGMADAIRTYKFGQAEVPVYKDTLRMANSGTGYGGVQYQKYSPFDEVSAKTKIIINSITNPDYDYTHNKIGPLGIIVGWPYNLVVPTRNDIDIFVDKDTTFPHEVVINDNIFYFYYDSTVNSSYVDIDFEIIPMKDDGTEFRFTPSQMVEEVSNLVDIYNHATILDEEDLVVSGKCSYRFTEGGWDWFIDKYGEAITTNDITHADYMFNNSAVKKIPFDINFRWYETSPLMYMFYSCDTTTLPKIDKVKPSGIDHMFGFCRYIKSIPEDYCDGWDWSYLDGLTSSYSGSQSYLFSQCISLRSYPNSILSHGNPYVNYSYSIYTALFSNCAVLDEIIDLPFPHYNASWTSNAFSNFINNCSRLKNMTFKLQEDGTPYVMKWRSQIIDLTTVGFANNTGNIKNYQAYHGITADKEVKDDATYQALKDNADWYSANINYSRYNHDSAVATINSLPDCSATGTNTIKFRGQAGALTDGGAINTLTEEEIAVAAAKGWTVSLV